MSDFELLVTGIGWIATCFLAWLIGYLTGRRDDEE